MWDEEMEVCIRSQKKIGIRGMCLMDGDVVR